MSGVNLPEIDINLSGDDVRAWGGESGPKLPPGKYTFDIVKVEEVPSKKGQPTLAITFKVADDGDQFGVELMKKYSLQQKALGRLKSLMMAAGCQLDKIRTAELLGSRIIADIVHVEGQGSADAQGNAVPGGTFCDVINETSALPAEPEAPPEPPPPPPPAAKGATKPAARRA